MKIGVFSGPYAKFATVKKAPSIGDSTPTCINNYGPRQSAPNEGNAKEIKNALRFMAITIGVVGLSVGGVLLEVSLLPENYQSDNISPVVGSVILVIALFMLTLAAISIYRDTGCMAKCRKNCVFSRQKLASKMKPYFLKVMALSIGCLVLFIGAMLLLISLIDDKPDNVLAIVGSVIAVIGFLPTTWGATLLCDGKKYETTRSVDAKHLDVNGGSIKIHPASKHNPGVSAYNNAPMYTPGMVYNNALMYPSEKTNHNVHDNNNPTQYPYVFGQDSQKNQNIAAVQTDSAPATYSVV